MENQEKKPECIQDLLKINKVNRITKFDQINLIYDYRELILNDKVVINSEVNNVILFDTDVFNSCYIIDELNKFLETEKFDATISYCDNQGIYGELFKDFFKDRFNVEKPIPVILVITGNKREDSDLFIITEPVLGTVTIDEFKAVKSILDGNDTNGKTK